jgi:hypothetical protein
MKLFIMSIVFCTLVPSIFADDSLFTNDAYAEYCFQKEKFMKLKLSKQLLEIKPISIAESDSVECNENDRFVETKHSFHIPEISDSSFLNGFSGGVTIRQICITRFKFDTIIKKIVDETMECNIYSEKKKQPAKISISFPREKSLIFANGKNILLKDMQKFIGKNILAKWELNVNCELIIDSTFSGYYYIRITGECPK